MKKVKWVLMGLLFIIGTAAFNKKEKVKINWMSIEEVNKLYHSNPKPILIDVYTDWCGWCKEMDRTTYRNEKLARYINEHFYAIKYNAESRDSVLFDKTRYGFNKKLDTNDFAVFLSGGRLEYPNTIFLSAIDAAPAPLPGYMKAKEMEAPLKYFGEKANAALSFVEFNNRLKKEW